MATISKNTEVKINLIAFLSSIVAAVGITLGVTLWLHNDQKEYISTQVEAEVQKKVDESIYMINRNHDNEKMNRIETSLKAVNGNIQNLLWKEFQSMSTNPNNSSPSIGNLPSDLSQSDNFNE
jgi:hypothetical protein